MELPILGTSLCDLRVVKIVEATLLEVSCSYMFELQHIGRLKNVTLSVEILSNTVALRT